ncbi:unnamed protein product [Ambrosiozyma monospora]|uniref:Unnamed protein product n=1 Tax=Ambrosiozyma monospora TaxID=43982 RepID=A0ACB5T4J6_AMBMO|nr:unnamed protein product [Ambrosiozyma monospora]
MSQPPKNRVDQSPQLFNGLTRNDTNRRIASERSLQRKKYERFSPFIYPIINMLQSPELAKVKQTWARIFKNKLVLDVGSQTKPFYRSEASVLDSLHQNKLLERLEVISQSDQSEKLLKLNPSSKPFRLKFMNYHNQIFEDSLEKHEVNINKVTKEEELDRIFKSVFCTGPSPFAEKLYDRVGEPEIISKPTLKNPILIIIFTSGESNNDKMTLVGMIESAQRLLKRKRLPQRLVCYHFVVLDFEKRWKQEKGNTLFGKRLLSMCDSFGCSISFWNSSSSIHFGPANGIKLLMSAFDIKSEIEV